MRQNLIQIRPKFKGGWYITNEALPGDREPKPVPQPQGGLGFYHYPRKMGKKRALERLKRVDNSSLKI